MTLSHFVTSFLLATYGFDVFNFLIDASDPKAILPLSRMRHGFFCTLMAAGLLAILFVGGWIAAVFFQVFLLFAVTFLGNFADAEGQLSLWIWIPSACVGLLVWLVVVVLPALWAILGFIGALIGVASSIRPSIAEFPPVILLANAAARLAVWVGLRFRR